MYLRSSQEDSKGLVDSDGGSERSQSMFDPMRHRTSSEPSTRSAPCKCFAYPHYLFGEPAGIDAPLSEVVGWRLSEAAVLRWAQTQSPTGEAAWESQRAAERVSTQFKKSGRRSGRAGSLSERRAFILFSYYGSVLLVRI
jgi:hypothetical protein